MTLSLTNISKTYPDGTKALRPTQLQVGSGEILSLLGPSGCGKTTLLRLIAGLEIPDAGGTIFFDDDDVTKVPVEQRAIGMVFQNYALFPTMTVRQNIAYGLKMQKLASNDIEERVDHVVELCRLSSYANRSVKALSGGQRQRVALARAFAPRPRMLLLDEPLSALDAALRDELRDELTQLLRNFGITAIFVTHDQDEALAIADRVAVMCDGVIVQTGTPEDLYRNPTTTFVAEFVGNAIRIGGVRDGAQLCLPGGNLPLPPSALAADHNAIIYVRAEDVRLHQDGPLSAEVSAVTFLGTHYRVTLSGATDEPLYCLHQGAVAPKLGEQVRLSIDPTALMPLISTPS